MRKLAYAFGVLVTLVVVIAVALPFIVDLNDYKDVIAAQVKSATGRDLRIEGSIGLSVLPTPTVSVSGVRLANVAGASARDMVSVKAAEARIALLPLLRGEVQVESFTLVEPVVELEVLADGSANWHFATAGGGAAVAAPQAGGAGAVRFDSVVIENGTIVYRDQRRGMVERIAGLDIVAGADSLVGPFRAEGGLVARVTGVAYQLQPGDHVDVISLVQRIGYDGRPESVSRIILHNVEIAAVGRTRTCGYSATSVTVRTTWLSASRLQSPQS